MKRFAIGVEVQKFVYVVINAEDADKAQEMVERAINNNASFAEAYSVALDNSRDDDVATYETSYTQEDIDWYLSDDESLDWIVYDEVAR